MPSQSIFARYGPRPRVDLAAQGVGAPLRILFRPVQDFWIAFSAHAYAQHGRRCSKAARRTHMPAAAITAHVWLQVCTALPCVEVRSTVVSGALRLVLGQCTGAAEAGSALFDVVVIGRRRTGSGDRTTTRPRASAAELHRQWAEQASASSIQHGTERSHAAKHLCERCERQLFTGLRSAGCRRSVGRP